jgi:hypothetical protein
MGEYRHATKPGLVPDHAPEHRTGPGVEQELTANTPGVTVIDGATIVNLHPWLAHPCFLLG